MGEVKFLLGWFMGEGQLQPQPRESYTLIDPDDAGRRRNLNCRQYDRCLDIAVEAKWGGFTCVGCPAYEPKTRMEMIRDARGLFAIFDRQK